MIDHWYQLDIKVSSDAISGRFSGQAEGPFDWPQVLTRAQQILNASMKDNRMAHLATVTKVELGSGALYRYGNQGWEQGEVIPALDSLPTDLGSLPITAGRQRGKLLLRLYDSDTKTAVKQFIDEDIDLEWVLATSVLGKVLVFDATLIPVTTIGVDPTVICENSGYPDFRDPSLNRRIEPSSPTPARTLSGLPIAGFRCWRLCIPSKIEAGQIVDGEPKLYGPNYGLPYIGLYEWAEAEKEADCMYSGRHPLVSSCPCGLYAFHDPDANALRSYYGYPKLSIETGVRGAVLGAGDILLHDEGWRAQSARIIGFVDDVPSRFQPALRQIAQKFDVPILSSQELVSLALRKGRVIRKSEGPSIT